jgi:hypothetical protein
MGFIDNGQINGTSCVSRSVEKNHVSNRGCRIIVVTWKICMICVTVSANNDDDSDTILCVWMEVASIWLHI